MQLRLPYQFTGLTSCNLRLHATKAMPTVLNSHSAIITNPQLIPSPARIPYPAPSPGSRPSRAGVLPVPKPANAPPTNPWQNSLNTIESVPSGLASVATGLGSFFPSIGHGFAFIGDTVGGAVAGATNHKAAQARYLAAADGNNPEACTHDGGTAKILRHASPHGACVQARCSKTSPFACWGWTTRISSNSNL